MKKCNKCSKPKGEDEGCCNCGRPTKYSDETVAKVEEYLATCIDGDKEDTLEEQPHGGALKRDHKVNAKLPTKGGLAKYLGIARVTIDDWVKKYPQFSYVIEKLGCEQEDRLINNGLSGNYNPTIAKVLLTKHGYREGIDQTTNDKDIPTPIYGGKSDV